MRITLLQSLIVLVVVCARSQERGTFDFLRLDINARAAALNGSFVSMTDDPNLLLYNPAALATVRQPAASAAFLKHLLDVNAGSMTYAQEVEGIGTFGAGVVIIDYGSFDRTDESMNLLGSFGAREFALVAGGAVPVAEHTYAGASLEFIHSSIAEFRSSALAVGAGILHTIPSENISIGASLLHIGSQLNAYGETRETLPLSLTVGITKKPEHLPAYLSINFHNLTEEADSFLGRFRSFTIGAEFLLNESLQLRVGYDNEKRRELKLGSSAGMAGFAVGGGISFGTYRFDYAFNSYGKIGGLHRITLGMLVSP